MSVKIPDTLIDKFSQLQLKVNIPKVIHQTYKSMEKLPGIWKKTPESWQLNNPEWKYMFWSDDDCKKLVREYFPDFLSIFNSYEYPIQRADAIRPILMYVFGGIYADCDIACKRPIDDLFFGNHEIYIIRTPATGTITNCIMASKKGAKFWLYIIEEMVNRFNNPSIFWIGKHITVMYTTGPMLFQHAYDNWKNKNEIGLLPKEYLLPSECNICTEKPCSTQFGYTSLLEGSSWCGLDSKIYNFFLCNYTDIIIFIVLAYIIYIFYSYCYSQTCA